ncbi:MAG: hypothetical protein AAGK10_05435 [Cyanobacteria bacterium J06555_3]
MSKGWAAIVYGRTYHLDFRFITIPDDFSADDLHWAAQYIVATTQKARNLADSPRWSLFKNEHYCIVGATCMVKDLLGKTVKDDRDRPLYVYVGYVTQLDKNLELLNFPAYSDRCLDDFKILYQEIEKVWLIKNYEAESRKPALSQYNPLNFHNSAIALAAGDLPILNSHLRHPEHIYLWSSKTAQNSLLWQAAAQFPAPVAVCLNIKGKALTNSLFLNQSSSQVEQFKTVPRTVTQGGDSNSNLTHAIDTQANNSLTQKISHRAKEDIDLTLQQAAKVAIAGQELIHNISDWNQLDDADKSVAEETQETLEFGFKLKNPATEDEDWF